MRGLHNSSTFNASPPMRQPVPSDIPPQAEKREWTISEMSRDFGLTLRALRFYESKGLIGPQRFGGARYYSARDRVRLTLIINAKRMGFTLSETAAMIGQAGEGEVDTLPLSPTTVDAQIAFLESQRRAIEAALGTLLQHQQALSASAA